MGFKDTVKEGNFGVAKLETKLIDGPTLNTPEIGMGFPWKKKWPLKTTNFKKIIERNTFPKIVPRKGTQKHEISVFSAETKVSHMTSPKKDIFIPQVIPVRVDSFDDLISDSGVEKGSTLLISGGCGTGKTTFALQSLYQGALKGERGIFISFEEDPEKIKAHMKKNFGWDFYKLEEKELICFIKLDPIKIARSVEALRVKEEGELRIKLKPIVLPFIPDRLVLDSLSALSIAFENEENYRKYIRQLFVMFEEYNSVNLIIDETEQNPTIYSRAGIEEFLADGVIVLYNLKVEEHRENALEILKLRSSKHQKRLVPYTIGPKGFVIFSDKQFKYKKAII